MMNSRRMRSSEIHSGRKCLRNERTTASCDRSVKRMTISVRKEAESEFCICNWGSEGGEIMWWNETHTIDCEENTICEVQFGKNGKGT